MAKKDLKANRVKLDDELDIPDFDFDNEIKPPKDDRKPATKVTKAFLTGAKETVMDSGFIANRMKDVMPEGYGRVMDTADSFANEGRKLYDKAAKEIKPSVNEFAKAAKSLSKDENSLVHKIMSGLEEWSAGDKKYSGDDKNKQREDNISLAMGDVFKFQAEQDAKAEARQNTSDKIKQGVETIRHKDNLTLLSNMTRSLSILEQYQTKLTANYQKKSLELQYRSLFLQTDMYELSKKSSIDMVNTLMEIKKNTALPDSLKFQGLEQMKNVGANKFYEKANEKLFGGTKEYFEKLSKNTWDVLSNKLDKMKEAFSMGLQGIDAVKQQKEMEEMTGSSGGSTSETVAGIAGGMGADELGRWLGDKLRGVTKGTKLETFFTRADTALENGIPAAIQKLISSGKAKIDTKRGKFVLFEGTPQEKRIDFSGKIDKANDNITALLKFLAQAGNVETGVQTDDFEKLTDAYHFTKQTHKTINEVIPGYLSRILREAQAIRTGEKNISKIDLVSYDFKKNSFSKEKELRASMQDFITGGEKGRNEIHGKVSNFVDDVIQNKNVSKETKNKMYKKAMADALAGKPYWEESYATEAAFGEEFTPQEKSALSEAFRQHHGLEYDEEDKTKLVKNKFFDNAEARTQYSKTKEFKDITRDIDNKRLGHIQQLINLGQYDLVRKMGVTDAEMKNIDLSKLFDPTKPTSDVTAKKNFKSVSPQYALNAVTNTPVTKWDYKEGRGDSGQHVGPMAQTVQKNMGNDAGPGGKKIDLVSMNGYNMAAIQGLDQRFTSEKLSQAEIYKQLLLNSKVANDLSTQQVSILTAIRQLNEIGISNAVGGIDPSKLASSFSNIKFTDGSTKSVMLNLFGSAGTLGYRGISGVYNLAKKAKDKMFDNLGKGYDVAKNWWSQPGEMMPKLKATTGDVLDVINSRYSKFKDSDFYVGGEVQPRIEKTKLQAGNYYVILKDGSKKQITKMEEITSDVWDSTTGAIAVKAEEIKNLYGHAKEKGKTIVGKLVNLGLNAAAWSKNKMFEAFDKMTDVLGMAKKLAIKAYTAIDQPMDIYVKGETKPRLLAIVMRSGGYLSEKTGNPILRPGQIDGAVKNHRGEIVLSEDDLKLGIVDGEGKSIRTPLAKILEFGLRAAGSAYRIVKNAAESVLGKVLGGSKTVGKFFTDGLHFGFGSKKAIDLLTQIRNILDERLNPENKMTNNYQDKETAVGTPEEQNNSTLVGDTKNKVKTLGKRALRKAQRKAKVTGQTVKEKAIDIKGKVSDKAEIAKDKAMEKATGIKGFFSSLLGKNKKIIGDTDGDGVREGSYKNAVKSTKKLNEVQKAQAKLPMYKNIFDSMIENAARAASALGSAASTIGGLFGRKGKVAAAGAAAATGVAGAAGVGSPYTDIATDIGSDIAGEVIGNKIANKGMTTGTTVAQGTGKPGLLKRGLNLTKNLIKSPFKMGAGLVTGAGAALGAIGRNSGTFGKALGLGAKVATAATLMGTGLSPLGATASTSALWGLGRFAGRGLLRVIPIVGEAVLLYDAGSYAVNRLTRNKVDKLGMYKFVQYGFNENTTQYVYKTKELEDMLTPYISYNKGQVAKLKQEYVEKTSSEIFDLFDVDPEDEQQAKSFMTWFEGRFTPIFLAYATALNEMGIDEKVSKIDNIDKDKKKAFLKAIRLSGIPAYDLIASPLKDIEYLPSGASEVSSFYETIKDTIDEEKATTVLSSTSKMWKTVKGWANTAWDKTKSVVSDVASNIWSGLKKSAEILGIDKPIEQAWKTVKDFATSSWDKTTSVVSDLWKSTKKWGMRFLAHPMDVTFDAIGSAFSWAYDGAKTIVSGAYGSVMSSQGYIVTPIESAIYKSYGLMDEDPQKIRGIKRIQQIIFEKVKYDGNIATAQLGDDTWSSLTATMQSYFPHMQYGNSANLFAWLKGRFLPVFLVTLSAIKALTGKKADASNAGLTDEQSLELVNKLTEMKDIWKVTGTFSPDLPLGGDPGVLSGILSDLKSKVEKNKQSKAKADLAKQQVNNKEKGGLGDKKTETQNSEQVKDPKQLQIQKDSNRANNSSDLKPAFDFPDAEVYTGSDNKTDIEKGATNIALISPKVAGGPRLDGVRADQFISMMKGVDINRLNPTMLKNFKGMVEEYGTLTGKRVQVNAGFRSYDEQKALYDKDPTKAARPGTSLHEYGLAIDINSKDADELDQLGLMKKYGFTRPVGGEPWHLEPAGVSINVDKAKNDPNAADSFIKNSIGRGGGGYGTIKSADKAKRNQDYAMKIYNEGSSIPDEPLSKDSPDVKRLTGGTGSATKDAATPNTGTTVKDQTAPGQQNSQVAKTADQPGQTPGSKPTPTVASNQGSYGGSMKQGVTLPAPDAEPNQNSTQFKNIAPGTGGAMDKLPSASGKGLQAVGPVIDGAAKMVGANPEFMKAVAAVESGLDPNAQSPTSSASGLFQFVKGTWDSMVSKYGKNYGINPGTSPLDPRANSLMGAQYIKDNTQALAGVKSNVNAVDVYMAHFLGTAGAKRFLKANPNDLAINNVDDRQIKPNMNIFYDNGRPRTVSEVYNLMKTKLVTKSGLYGLKLDVGGGLQTNVGKEVATIDTGVSRVTNGSSNSSSYGGSTNSSSKSSSTVTTTENYSKPSYSITKPFSPRGENPNALIQTQDTRSDFNEVMKDVPDVLRKSLDVQKEILDILKKVADKQPTQQSAPSDTTQGLQTPAVQANPLDQKPTRMVKPPVSMARANI